MVMMVEEREEGGKEVEAKRCWGGTEFLGYVVGGLWGTRLGTRSVFSISF